AAPKNPGGRLSMVVEHSVDHPVRPTLNDQGSSVNYDSQFQSVGDDGHIRSTRKQAELIAEILREYERSGDAMRYLNAKGQIAWKASPSMLSRLADAEARSSTIWQTSPDASGDSCNTQRSTSRVLNRLPPSFSARVASTNVRSDLLVGWGGDAVA